jgi:hypothetical protein
MESATQRGERHQSTKGRNARKKHEKSKPVENTTLNFFRGLSSLQSLYCASIPELDATNLVLFIRHGLWRISW